MNGVSIESNPISAGVWLYLDEATHRAVNDYTAMLAMLRRATASMTDAAGRSALNDVANRLRAAATVCTALRPPHGLSVRRLDDDLQHLCKSLSSSLLADRSIRLTLACEPICLTSRRSWQLSLILSELIMNAARHAFSGSNDGEIFVDIAMHGGTLRCAVADNGVGTPDAPSGRGSHILDALAADLGGSIARQFAETGSTIVLRAPVA